MIVEKASVPRRFPGMYVTMVDPSSNNQYKLACGTSYVVYESSIQQAPRFLAMYWTDFRSIRGRSSVALLSRVFIRETKRPSVCAGQPCAIKQRQ